MEKLFRIISKKYKLINNKVFCVGANKTGTTSIGEFLKETGYRVAPQIPAERFINTWAIRDFRLLFQFCRKYEAFQDIPFSLDYTFQFLDFNFPNSKFILTIRSSAEEWLESYRRFATEDKHTSPERKVKNTIKEIAKKLQEIETMVNYNTRLKTESGVAASTYGPGTQKALTKISERLIKISERVRALGE